MISVSDLERFPIFSGLDRGFLTDIAKTCLKRSYRAGEICVLEGAPARYLHLLMSGKINLERKLPDKWLLHEVGVVHTLEERGLFGWSAIVEPGVHTASARCLEDCEIILIQGEKLSAVLDSGGKASYQFMRRLASVIALRLIDTSNFMLREMADFAAYRAM